MTNSLPEAHGLDAQKVAAPNPSDQTLASKLYDSVKEIFTPTSPEAMQNIHPKTYAAGGQPPGQINPALEKALNTGKVDAAGLIEGLVMDPINWGGNTVATVANKLGLSSDNSGSPGAANPLVTRSMRDSADRSQNEIDNSPTATSLRKAGEVVTGVAAGVGAIGVAGTIAGVDAIATGTDLALTGLDKLGGTAISGLEAAANGASKLPGVGRLLAADSPYSPAEAAARNLAKDEWSAGTSTLRQYLDRLAAIDKGEAGDFKDFGNEILDGAKEVVEEKY